MFKWLFLVPYTALVWVIYAGWYFDFTHVAPVAIASAAAIIAAIALWAKDPGGRYGVPLFISIIPGVMVVIGIVHLVCDYSFFAIHIKDFHFSYGPIDAADVGAAWWVIGTFDLALALIWLPPAYRYWFLKE